MKQSRGKETHGYLSTGAFITKRGAKRSSGFATDAFSPLLYSVASRNASPKADLPFHSSTVQSKVPVTHLLECIFNAIK